MAQRGGSVSTQVRFGEKVFSPLVGLGQADVMVAFERMEALRYAGYMKPGGICVVNDYRLTPMSVAVSGAVYPENAIEAMAERFCAVPVKAADIAISLGNARCMNVVLFGAASAVLRVREIDWEDVIVSVVPEKLRDLNLKAFRAGAEAAGTGAAAVASASAARP